MNTREQAIEAAAQAICDESIHCEHTDDMDADECRVLAHMALDAALPVLLNDLADAVQDAIENDRRSHNVVPGLGFAVELETAKLIARDAVRAAAEGWGQ